MSQTAANPIPHVADWRLIEYQQLNENVRMLYTAFYNLATMTFTWNASLGTAVGFIQYYQHGIPSKPIFWLLVLVLPLIAALYNWGALTSFHFIYSCFNQIALAMEGLQLPTEMQIKSILRSAISGKGEFPLDKLTMGFFWGLIAIWMLLFLGEFALTIGFHL